MSSEGEAPVSKGSGKKGNSKTRFPDDSKCNRCFKSGAICDRDTKGTPCTRCSRYHSRCVDQTPETKELIPKENRDKPRRKLLEVEPEEQPCRRCYQKRRKRKRTKGPTHPCDGCLGEKRNCNSDIAGADQVPLGRIGGIKGLKGVPFEQKCYRCSKTGLSCDGKTPCSTCGSKYQCVSQEHKEATRDHPKCIFCQHMGMTCDKKRPCSTCIRKGQNCSHRDQEGLVKRTYLVKGAPKFWNEDDDVWLAESEDECVTCKLHKRNCSQEQPCYTCVRTHDRRPTSKNHQTCTWIRSNGVIERYNIRPYTLDEKNNVVLRPDYQEHTHFRRPRSEKDKALAEESESEDSTGGSGPEFRISARNAPSNAKDVEARLRREGLLDSAGPPQTNNAHAQSAFDAAFPNGRYEVIPTQSTGLECGFYAIINSMRAQHPELPQPTLQDLRGVFHSREFTEHAAAFGLNNMNNFTADQVGAVTHFWADTYHDLNIQLGYFSEGRGPDLVPTPGSDQNKQIVLWIHNDNAQDRAEQDGLDAEGVMNHYSGLRCPGTRAQKKNASSKKRPRKQLSDTDSES